MAKNRSLSRRDFMKSAAVAGATLAFPTSIPGTALGSDGKVDPHKRVIVLGMDGLDPNLVGKFMEEGRMPTFRKLKEVGGFRRLTTSIPPQSPVAWSNFITGHDSGWHGIFDFIQRRPLKTEEGSDRPSFEVYLSTVLTEKDKWILPIGDWRIPLRPGGQSLGRKGKAFWEVLDDYGIRNVILHIPANYPPVQGKGEAISGMDTPALDGGYGSFSYYTTTRRKEKESVSGGVIYGVKIGADNVIDATLVGLRNPFRVREKEKAAKMQPLGLKRKAEKPEVVELSVDCEIPFRVHVDPEYPVARIEIQDQVINLQEGEWSDWVPVTFEIIPHVTEVTGICKFYLQQLSTVGGIRDFSLYVSPIEVDPANPSLTITQPPEYAQNLYEHLGRFHTQGMPTDNKALDAGVFTDEDFIRQGGFVIEERERLLDYELERFKEGFFFFYFTESDLMMHSVWRLFEEDHPARHYAVDPDRFKDIAGQLYEQMDRALAKVLRHVDDRTTLIVMSDHGFVPFMRQVNLNTWLLEKGYIRLTIDVDSAKEREKAKDFKYVDWKNTKAYAVGLNGIYVNLRDREIEGSVRPEEKEEVLRTLSRDLLEFQDPGWPEDPYNLDSPGRRVISSVFRSDQVYHGDHAKDGPDLVVGYARGYRVSKASPLGDFPEGAVSDNTDAWSGDHCIDPQWVPGVFFTNKRIAIENPALSDLAGIILSEFGIAEDPDIPISKDPLLVGDPAGFAEGELSPDKGKPELLRSHAYFGSEEKRRESDVGRKQDQTP